MARTCFVVIPFGEKPCGVNPDGSPRMVNFDDVFDTVIKPAVEGELKYECKRAKDDHAPGSIPEQMYRSLISADLVVADISQHNANVYYELGVRHAIRPNTTVLLKHASAPDTPFDIAVLKHAPYDNATEEGRRAGQEAIIKAVRDARSGEPDSDVHRIIAADRLATGPITGPSARVEFSLKDRPETTIGYVTGELLGVTNIDVWVNSENTQMQMARFCESAVSASLRFHGANNFVHNDAILASDDSIANKLSLEAGKVMKRQLKAVLAEIDDAGQRAQLNRVRRKGVQVAPHTVILTHSGNLGNAPNNVRLLAHVAAVQGRPTKGFTPVDDIGKCVTAVLSEITTYNQRRSRKKPLQSVLFPIFGTGQAKQDPARIVDQLISAAADFFSEETSPHVPRKVMFLAHTMAQKIVLDRELDAFPNLERAAAVVEKRAPAQKGRAS